MMDVFGQISLTECELFLSGFSRNEVARAEIVPANRSGACPYAKNLKLWRNKMKYKLLGVVLFTLLTTALNATSVFASGMQGPESITQTASGNFLVTDFTGAIWTVPATGGTASLLATVPFSALGGIFLPGTFDSVGGRFLAVGFGVQGAIAVGQAYTINTSVTPATVTPYFSEARASWPQVVLPSSFGPYTGNLLVTNEHHAVDFFAPTGVEGTVANFPESVEGFGAALAPSNFGAVGGTLLVSDLLSGAIYSVDSSGNVSRFATIPLSAGQTGLRNMAFAPQGFGLYSGDLFVSVNPGVIYVVDVQGMIVGHISGSFAPRGLLFTGGRLLFSDTSSGEILSAGPGDVKE